MSDVAVVLMPMLSPVIRKVVPHKAAPSGTKRHTECQVSALVVALSLCNSDLSAFSAATKRLCEIAAVWRPVEGVTVDTKGN